MIVNHESLSWLKTQEENSVDSIVTDPPYLISFMGKDWDNEDSVAGNPAFWKEALRVLKPGGHIAVFSHSRTYHRVASAIEDAGFEIRDQIMWVYGSGFPKSHNIGKAYDKKLGTHSQEKLYDKALLTHLEGATYQHNDGRIFELKPNTSGRHTTIFEHGSYEDVFIEKVEQTNEWSGWGTALKPSHEPIVLARKPLSEKSVVDNVIKWGTGGINIDGCRVPSEETIKGGGSKVNPNLNKYGAINSVQNSKTTLTEPHNNGRFPANFIHDGIDAEWSKYFYCAKVSKKERNIGMEASSNNHPTVKPVALMAYLCRLITPKNGIVLDPFAGSGSTGMACKQEGFDFIGIEREEEYCKIAEARIAAYNGK